VGTSFRRSRILVGVLTMMMGCGAARAGDLPHSTPRPGGGGFGVRGRNSAFDPIAYGAVGDARVCENDASIRCRAKSANLAPVLTS
jgi:hypothetical protein